MLVKESSQEIIALVIEYRRKCYSKSDEIAP
ncbi:MAG TPA: hypothetical protein PLU67_06965 [Candidatus Kapabacteria bacterium]|nr:hypothetical protein [Candidatus Kapabacteria bacterium]